MTRFILHPQLRADCHQIGPLTATHLLLHRNAALPWFILVPETDLANLLDLPSVQREAVLADCKRISDHLSGTLGYPRVNVAWIGNLVPQLHIHVIGRRPGDPCWPQPVWGHLEVVAAYSPEEIERFRLDLSSHGRVGGSILPLYGLFPD
ncbi:HIT family protein [Thiocapsa imhoffii]|uniref:HIT family protein n=1 Tax=Thiocapsa imhoffii TaxID=382777 RepID=A0A9X0WKT7_9GAMM|nr:HIT domain-containing protein [Thiocapsa imhoffii]MBK1646602.1 HIT family protein [Thiocapsa imhoffii]